MLLRTLKILLGSLLLATACRATPVTSFLFTENATEYWLNVSAPATSDYSSVNVYVDDLWFFGITSFGSGLSGFSFTYGALKSDPSQPWYFQLGFHDITALYYTDEKFTENELEVDIGTYLVGPPPGRVPEGGATAGLLVAGLVGLAAIRRRI